MTLRHHNARDDAPFPAPFLAPGRQAEAAHPIPRRPAPPLARPLAAATLLAAAVLVAGCASRPGLPASAPVRDGQAFGLPAAGAAADAVRIDPAWWRGLGDAQLDRLVAQALEGHPDLRQAQARLARAQAAAGMADAALMPQAGMAVDATRQLYTARGAVPPPLAGSIRESGAVQLQFAWELDFFGRNRAALEAALGAARAAQAQADAARNLVAGQVVRAYVHLGRMQGQVEVAERALAQREEMLRLVTRRVQAGLDSQLELQQAQGAVPEARAQLEAAREQAQLSRHALAAWIGQPLQDPAPLPVRLAQLRPLSLPQSLPANLLGQRPDIAAALWRVEAAGHDIDNARALFYPNINLMAFAGVSAIGLSNLGETASRQWGVGPVIRLPIFESGRLRENLRGKAADREAAIASYDAAVIDALREVSDQATSVRSIAQQQGKQAQAQQAAQAAYGIARRRYEAGLGNYLQVLSAESALLAQRRLGVDLSARLLDAQALLARALGGGWQPGAGLPALNPPAASAQARTAPESNAR